MADVPDKPRKSNWESRWATNGLDIPIAIVDLDIGAQKRLLTLLIRPIPPDLISIFLRLQQRNEINP